MKLVTDTGVVIHVDDTRGQELLKTGSYTQAPAKRPTAKTGK